MKEIHFPNWREVLEQTKLTEHQKRSFEITLRWFLSFCRRGRAAVTVQSARDFVEGARQEKKAEAWQVEQWKEALNWFFKESRVKGFASRG